MIASSELEELVEPCLGDLIKITRANDIILTQEQEVDVEKKKKRVRTAKR